MKVYRLQHIENKLGPYNNKGLFESNSTEFEFLRIMKYEHSDKPDNHPGPVRDNMEIDSEHIFGCETLNGLYSWFEGFIDYLLGTSYSIT